MPDEESPSFSKYVAPSHDLRAYHCPHPKCGVYAKQRWFKSARYYVSPDYNGEDIGERRFDYVVCDHCKDVSIWREAKLVYPVRSLAPHPHMEMPKSILPDYEEARNVLIFSPRASAALLRLATEKLAQFLVSESGHGQSGDLNSNIGILVKDGLPRSIQQALDSLRVIGNEAVHPGMLDLKDDNDTAIKLFRLLNVIIENRISEPKEIGDLYAEKIPDSKKEQIAERDKPQTAK